VKAITIFALILSLFGWMGVSRLVRSQIITLREQSFIEATRALGAGPGRIVFRHMLPNALAPIIVATTLATGNFIILESTLSYLGYGVDPLTPTWGNMLFSVQEVIWSRPLLALYPGLMILITVLSINFVGDALRDALDPRLKR
jgi:peptide/nickel transport system permease protein